MSQRIIRSTNPERALCFARPILRILGIYLIEFEQPIPVERIDAGEREILVQDFVLRDPRRTRNALNSGIVLVSLLFALGLCAPDYTAIVDLGLTVYFLLSLTSLSLCAILLTFAVKQRDTIEPYTTVMHMKLVLERGDGATGLLQWVQPTSIKRA